jgi:putative tryptophan/tyrosine transport system substrate-binding protein
VKQLWIWISGCTFSIRKSKSKNVCCLTLALTLGTLNSPVEAQQFGKVPRIGFLIVDSPSAASTRVEAFKEGLQELGYVEAKSITLEYRYAEGKADRLPQLASELVRLKIDVLVTGGGNQVAIAAMNATGTIPIVMTNVADPVGSGFVASLARPGGNVTGLTSVTYDLSGKRLELIKETLPRLGRIAVLYDPSDRAKVVEFKEMQAAAGSFAVQLQSLEVRRPEDFESAFSAGRRARAEALIVLPTTVTNNHRKPIVDLAAGTRLAAIYPDREFVDTGGLMSYGPIYADLWRRAATYVDKILKGAKPAELPIEQPTKFELVINLKTASQIGLTIPPNVLARADRVVK